MTRALDVDALHEEPPDTVEAPLWRTLRFARSANGRLLIATLLGAASAAASIALLATSAWLIARAAQRPTVVVLGLAIIGVRFFAITRGLSRYGERLVGHDAALRVLARLRVEVYDHLETLAPAGLPVFRRGDLLARLVHDVDALQDLMLRVVPPYAIALLVGIPTVGLVWYFLAPAGAVLALSLAVTGTFVPWYARHSAKLREHRESASRGELSARVIELLEAAPELVAFGAVDSQLSRVLTADEELTTISRSASNTIGIGAALVTAFSGLAIWGILYVGIPAVHGGHISGPILALITFIPLAAFDLVSVLPNAAQAMERVRQAAGRIFAVIDARPPVLDRPDPVELPLPPYGMRVRGLRVRYRDGEDWALDGVDLDLPPGRRVGVVGPSGAGKTTLTAVLSRFVPYQHGVISLGGVELRDLAGDDARRVVGVGAQETHVFDTTLRENLLLARRDATEDELMLALRRARLADWVDSLPEGLATELGEEGNKMSGGQRQRLGIARVLLADFPIVIFDEPGEHLDVATADALVADLVELTEGKTTVMITHRMVGLEAMDEIIVLEGGRVSERGTHAELLVAGGSYARECERERRVEVEGELVS